MDPENPKDVDGVVHQPPPPNRRGQLHGAAAAGIRELIVSGELPPGTQLREHQLCTRLGVSRTPVREALRTLAAEGLVELLPNRSVVVASIDPTEIEHLYKVFATLEALAAELACARITAEEIGEIGRLLSDMVDLHDRRERAAYLKLNQTIHRRTVEIAGNPILLAQWQALVPRVERTRGLPNLDRERWSAALFEHTKMFAALAARDGRLLADLTHQHFLNAIPILCEPNHVAESRLRV